MEYVDLVFVAAACSEYFSATLIHIYLAFFPLSDGVLGDIHSSTTEMPEKHQTLFLWPSFGIREVVSNSLWNFGKTIY